MASGSATGNPRNKVALKPGHSLMDWIRLGNSGKDLTGVNGVFTNVTKAELAEHKSMDDAWLCIRGIVYNVTHYMDFHPGGCDELMRGAGTDATNLFNQVHAWVNYESILKKCVVGRIGSSGDEDLFSVPSSPDKSFSSLRITSDNEKFKSIKMNWCQQLAFITLIFNTHVPDPQVQLVLIKPDVLQCKIMEEVHIFNLEAKISWPIHVSVDVNGKVQLQLMKKKPELWKKYGKVAENNRDFINPDFWSGKILQTVKVTHDSYLITLKYDNFIYNYVNPGYHIVIKKTLNDIEARPYTPVPTLPLSKSIPPGEFRKSDEEINLLIKVYKDGFMSSWISSHPGTTLFISNPIGSFKTTLLNKISEIYFFAGGTGITPMIGIMNWALKTSSDKILKLFYFNKSQEDIIWNTELEELASSFSNRFMISHVLSQPDLGWSGRTGHINLELMKSVLPAPSEPKFHNDFVFICGRPSFADDTERFLIQHMGYTMENYFNFNRNTP